MNTIIHLADPAHISPETEAAVCQIAATGFEQPNNEAMRADTIRHIRDAGTLQLAYDNGEMVAFSLYGSSLWQPGS